MPDRTMHRLRLTLSLGAAVVIAVALPFRVALIDCGLASVTFFGFLKVTSVRQ